MTQYRGAQLNQARQFIRERPELVGLRQCEFVEAGARESRKRFFLLVASSLIAIVSVAVVLRDFRYNVTLS